VTFSSTGYNVNSAWTDITNAIKANYLVGVDTASFAEFALPGSHAYAILGAYELLDTNGNVVHRLYRIRNPWGVDVYDGPWDDSSSLWTAAFKAQVPYVNNVNDGAFFVEDTDFVNAFAYYEIGYVNDSWVSSYYSKTSDSGSMASYTFTTKNTQELYLIGALYDSRMYPNGCKNFYTSGKLYLYSGTTLVAQTTFTD
jgi:hypothetical protein